MTDEEIKTMLKDIIDNGADYKGRPSRKCSNCVNCRLCDWKDYKLGDEIHSNWEYRKVDSWYVINDRPNEFILVCNPHSPHILNKSKFKGTKEECEKWIEEHTKKTWLENAIESQLSHPFALSCSNFDIKKICFKNEVEEVCKKILEEIHKHSYYANTYGQPEVIKFEDVFKIIKDLGVEV